MLKGRNRPVKLGSYQNQGTRAAFLVVAPAASRARTAQAPDPGNARGVFVGAHIFCAMGGGCSKAAIAQ